ncbi:MAG TPA: hypothetical protein VK497_02895 [Candidatus Saccharimonadales bacterium]|nr:hypothetical protein [Candidatus Saccharimonadales bacterium]
MSHDTLPTSSVKGEVDPKQFGEYAKTANHLAYSPETPVYYEVDSNANVLPLDPVTGNRLRAGEIPESLLADPELRKGYDYFRNNGSRIRFGLLLTTHGTAEDLIESGVSLAAEAKELAELQGVLFLEGNFATSAGKQSEIIALNRSSHLPYTKARQRQEMIRSLELGATFQGEELAQITGTNVELACPDFVRDSDRPADTALTEWQIQLKYMRQKERVVQGDDDKYWSLLMGYTIYRDCYLVGKMGAYLADRPEDFSDETDDAVYAKLLAGPTHAGIGQYIEGFGASVEYSGETSDKLSPQNARVVKAAGAAMLTLAARVDQLASTFLLAKR